MEFTIVVEHYYEYGKIQIKQIIQYIYKVYYL